jgi:hypothetical protein
MQPQQPQSLWQGISQGDSSPVMNGNMSPIAQMLAKQQVQQDPRAFMPTIDPGRTWGGRDSNNVHPYDVQVSRTNALPPENI